MSMWMKLVFFFIFFSFSLNGNDWCNNPASCTTLSIWSQRFISWEKWNQSDLKLWKTSVERENDCLNIGIWYEDETSEKNGTKSFLAVNLWTVIWAKFEQMCVTDVSKNSEIYHLKSASMLSTFYRHQILMIRLYKHGRAFCVVQLDGCFDCCNF